MIRPRPPWPVHQSPSSDAWHLGSAESCKTRICRTTAENQRRADLIQAASSAEMLAEFSTQLRKAAIQMGRHMTNEYGETVAEAQWPSTTKQHHVANNPFAEWHPGKIDDCDHDACKAVVAATRRGGVVGVGPDAEIETNENGAKQARTAYAMTSIDPWALLALARVHAEGDAKYGKNNWRGIRPDDHINHAMVHLTAWLAGDQSDDHLAHALCRIEMALALDLQRQRRDAEDG